MAGERLSVDELLSKQTALRATVEAVAGDQGRVKVTPFGYGSGCACSSAIVLDKGAIADLVTTDDFHDCCGQRFPVVEVTFADDRIADIFRQLAESAAKRFTGKESTATGRQSPGAGGGMRRGSGPPYNAHDEWCMYEGQDCALRCDQGDFCCLWDCQEWTEQCMDHRYRKRPCPRHHR